MPGLQLLQHYLTTLPDQSSRFLLLESPQLASMDRLEAIRVMVPAGVHFQPWYSKGLPDQPLAPFLPWIREALEPRSTSEIGEFLAKTAVYDLQREVFFRYFNNEPTHREEDLILEEKDFEKQRCLETIDRQLKLLWGVEPRLIYLSGASSLSCATLDYLAHLSLHSVKRPWLFLIEYHPAELQGAPPAWRTRWDQFSERLENQGAVLTYTGMPITVDSRQKPWKWSIPRDNLQLFFNFFCFDDVVLGGQQRIEDLGRTFMAGMEEAFLRDIVGTAWLCLDELDQADVHFHNLLVIAKEKGLTGVLAEAYRKTGFIQYRKDNSDTALRFAYQSLKLAENNHNDKGIFRALFLILMIDARENQLDKATYEDVYFRLIKTGETLDQRNHLAYWMARPDRIDPIARAAEVDALQDRAIRVLEKMGNLFRLAAAYHTKGFTYIVRGQFQQVPYYYKRSERLKLQMGNPLETAYIQNGMGYFYHQRSDNRRAEAYLFKALTNARRARDFHEVAMVLCNISINYTYSEHYQAAYQYLHELIELLAVLKIPGLSYHSPFEIRALFALAALRTGRTLRFWEEMGRLRNNRKVGAPDESRLQSLVEETLLYQILEAWSRGLQGWEEAAEEGFAEAEEYFLRHLDIVSYRGNFLYGEWQKFREQASPALAARAAELSSRNAGAPWNLEKLPPRLTRLRPSPDFRSIRESARMEVNHQEYLKKLQEIQFLKALQVHLSPHGHGGFLRGVLELIRNSFVGDFVAFQEYRPQGPTTHLAPGSAALSEDDQANLERVCESWSQKPHETLIDSQKTAWPPGLPGQSWLAIPVKSSSGWTGLLVLGTLKTQISLTVDDSQVLSIACQQITAHLDHLATRARLLELTNGL